MSLSLTDVADVLKVLWPDGLDARLIMKNHVLLPMLPRDREFNGRNVEIPLRWGKPQGRSHTFSRAQFKEDGSTAPVGSKYNKFVINSVTDYGTAHLDGDTVRRTKKGNNETQFIDLLDAEMSGALETLGDNLAKEAFRNHGGARGVVGSISSDTITLEDPQDIVFFEVGMEIQLSDDDGTTGSLRDAGDSLEITAVDEDAGSFTCDSSISDISGASAGDYIFQAGDFGLAATGLASYLPATAPTSGDDLHGLDRSANPTRLAGIRFDGSSYEMDEVWIQAQARAFRSGLKLSHFICHPDDKASVELALESRKRIVEIPTEYDGIGFQGIAVASGGMGDIPLVCDADCPKGVAYGLELDTWTWGTEGEAPTLIDEDGLEIMRSGTADAYELRVVAQHNYWTNAPGRNMRISLPSGS